MYHRIRDYFICLHWAGIVVTWQPQLHASLNKAISCNLRLNSDMKKSYLKERLAGAIPRIRRGGNY